MAHTTARFKVGDKVAAIAFENCFGEQVKRTDGLTVEHVRLVHHEPLPERLAAWQTPDYYRITARDGWRMVEGAERFFELQG